eukprot:1700685-Rhodomonas_salina.1
MPLPLPRTASASIAMKSAIFTQIALIPAHNLLSLTLRATQDVVGEELPRKGWVVPLVEEALPWVGEALP